METVQLTPAVASTRLGFGCAGLMREPSRKLRQQVLDAAFEQGIRHFDVARMYGLGAAEGELGHFARGRRESIVIATKFGIEAAAAPGRLGRLQSPARSLLARYPKLRAQVKRRSGRLHQPRCYDVATARASLERSLRELGTDYVDILFLHGPEPGDAIELEALGEYLEEARRAGRVRAWGLAGEHDLCLSIERQLPAGTVLQVRDDALARTAALAEGPRPLITFGVLAGALERIREHFSASPGSRERWSQRLGVDCTNPEALAALLLRDALAANRAGVVLLSTTQPRRLTGLDSLVSSARDDVPELAVLRRLVEEDLAPVGAAG
jgi:D-threo-aldose 1-dehydrogenase